jgi:tRNA(Arg) A34 adenosine deaminase TadA
MAEDHTPLTVKDLRILRNLQVMAQDVAPVKTARMAAAVAIRGQVMALGNNQLKSHPWHNRFRKNDDALFWHAETHCIHNFLRKHDLHLLPRATLYVVRLKHVNSLTKQLELGMARPCKGCMGCIEDFGIPRIVYSNREGGFTCEQSE